MIDFEKMIDEVKDSLKSGKVNFETKIYPPINAARPMVVMPYLGAMKPFPECDEPEHEKESKVNIDDLFEAAQHAHAYLKAEQYESAGMMIEILLKDINKIKEDYEKSKSENGSGN